LGFGGLVLRNIHKLEEWHISGIPTVHGLIANLTLGITPLLERQPGRRHLIFGPAIGTFENDHLFTVRRLLMM
jgi:hypothetical protein